MLLHKIPRYSIKDR